MVVVDAGNLLFKNTPSATKKRSDTAALISAQGIVRAYHEMSYDAVALSTDDLTAGLDFFRKSTADSFPWVASNVFDDQAKPLFAPYIIKNIGNITIGIIGLTGGPEKGIEGIVIGDWRTALKIQIGILKDNCDMLLLLSTLNSLENQEIQRNFEEIDIIVTADRKVTAIPPRIIGSSLLVQSGGRGKYIGRLGINGYGEGEWTTTSTISPQHQKNRLLAINHQIDKLKLQQKRTNRDFSQKIARLQAAHRRLSDQIHRQTSKMDEAGTRSKKTFTSSTLAVKPISVAGNIDKIVADIKKSTTILNTYRRAGLKTDDQTLRLSLQIDEIAGFTACASCHQEQTNFWQKTRHAKAYDTLVKQGQSFNLQCLPCHVTGGKVNASSVESELLFLLSLDPDRRTIGCEVCHGPANDHSRSPDQVTPVRLPAETLCTKCHTTERDGHFNYRKKIAIIACPSK